MRIVPLLRLVFHVRNGDRDPTRLLFRRIVNRVKRPEVGLALKTQDLGDRCRQRRLAVVYVSNRTHVHVGLVAYKYFFCHDVSFSLRFE